LVDSRAVEEAVFSGATAVEDEQDVFEAAFHSGIVNDVLGIVDGAVAVAIELAA